MASEEPFTKRLDAPRQDLNDAYSLPANFLEIEVVNPETHGIGWRQKYTDYEVKMKTNLPVFKVKESSVRRRYSDFEWLRAELERDSKIVVPPLPGKALKRQLPFRGDEGIFDDEFIEERRKGLEMFVNKVAGHPLAQNEKCLHMFLQEQTINKNYVPVKSYIVRWHSGKICKKVLERIENGEKLIENARNKIYDIGFTARREKIAIIMPYRDRLPQLREFLQHMIPIWQRQNLNYWIYVIEQNGNGLFNRGKLLNVGFKQALKDQDYDCFVFHDVDIFLENPSCSYSCHPNLFEVNHISAFLDKYEYQHRKYKIRCPPKEYPHGEINNVGGILMMRREQFQNVNGFSNMFWGWGGEDDDLYLRIWRKGLAVHEDPNCTFCMLKHSASEPNHLKHRLFNVSFARQEKEGLNSLKYEVFARQLTALYTKVSVDIGSPSEKLVEILNQKRKGKEHCDGSVLLGPGVY